MARGLQSLVLAREAILAPEWSSIEEFLGVNTLDCYRVLAEVGQGAWHPENDAAPWVRFCLTAHYIQATSVLRRVRESESIWMAVDEIRKSHQLHERTLPNLFDATIGLRIRNSSYRSAVELYGEGEIASAVASSDLRSLVELGLLERRGAKRGTFYVAGQPLVEVGERIRSTRRPIDASGLFDA